MNVITTKQLRNDMAQIVRDLRNGKHVQLSYRHKIIGTLQPIAPAPESQRRGSAAGIQQFLAQSPFSQSSNNSQRSFKAELSELRDRELDRT